MSILNEVLQWAVIALIGVAPWVHYEIYIRRRNK